MSDDQQEEEPHPIDSFKAHGKSVCVWSEKFGVEIWLVPELTGEEIPDGFEATLRRRLAGESAPSDEPSPSVAGEALSTSSGTLTIESARDILRKERLLGAIDGF